MSRIERRKVESVVKNKLNTCNELWTKVTDASKVIMLQDVKRMCDESGIKAPRRLLLSLALCLAGEFRYAPVIVKKEKRHLITRPYCKFRLR